MNSEMILSLGYVLNINFQMGSKYLLTVKDFKKFNLVNGAL